MLQGIVLGIGDYHMAVGFVVTGIAVEVVEFDIGHSGEDRAMRWVGQSDISELSDS